MFRGMLRYAWLSSRDMLLVLGTAAFLIPLASVRLAWKGDSTNIVAFLGLINAWGLLYPVLALLTGAVLAARLTASDRRGQRIYALTLPIAPPQYVWLQFGTGAVLLLVVVGALTLGTLVALAGIELPPGLRSYAAPLVIRFAAAALLLFALCYTLAWLPLGTGRWLARGLAAVLVLVTLLLLVSTMPWMSEAREPLQWLTILFRWPGPFEVLAGRWMLIDI